MKKSISEQIDYAIKYIWMHQITDDYSSCSLLKEDTLKNAYYHHLRNSLDSLCKKNNIRIYTEFNEKGLKSKGLRADIAIVSLESSKKDKYYLGDRVEKVLAIIELKFKGRGSAGTAEIFQDIYKSQNYIKNFSFLECQYYLGIIHEHNYSISEIHWLDKRQSNNWAKGRLTELNACYYEEYEKDTIGFSVCSYNEFNAKLNCRNKNDIMFVSMK